MAFVLSAQQNAGNFTKALFMSAMLMTELVHVCAVRKTTSGFSSVLGLKPRKLLLLEQNLSTSVALYEPQRVLQKNGGTAGARTG